MMRAMVAVVLCGMTAVGCTPAMHRAYRVSMTSAATAAWACDAMQTNAAVSAGMAVETNPFLGDNPSPTRIWASMSVSIAHQWAILAIPANRRPLPLDDYLKDLLVTIPAIIEGLVVISNARLMDRPTLRCGN